MWNSFPDFVNWLVGMVYWIFLPAGLGIFLLPFTPYIVRRFINKSKKPLPSFTPFWATLIPLVLLMNWIWGGFFNGHVYYEWDSMFVAYSLVSYDHPVIDGKIKDPQIASRMFYGLSVWHLYAIWLLITLIIYALSTTFTLWKNKKDKNFLLYKKILFIS